MSSDVKHKLPEATILYETETGKLFSEPFSEGGSKKRNCTFAYSSISL